jgi:dCTP deaminase
MFLSDDDIGRVLSEGDLVVQGLKGKVQPSSIELHLGNQFSVFGYDPESAIIDPDDPPKMYPSNIPNGEQYLLGANRFVLAHTIEVVELSDKIACQVDGKSSLARLGLQVHMTSGFIDPGFRGQITLELFNVADRPMILRPGMLIAQMFVYQLSSPAKHPYGHPAIDSRYQDQVGAQPSRGVGRPVRVIPEAWGPGPHVHINPGIATVGGIPWQVGEDSRKAPFYGGQARGSVEE